MTQSLNPPSRVELVHHQFDDYAQQHEAASLGMWCFLVTEVLFFGAVITAYAVCRLLHPAAWEEASHGLHLLLGSINTAILLTSSLAMALGVKAARLNRRSGTIALLLLTAALGCCFLGVKGYEYSLEISEHKFPLLGFRQESSPHPPADAQSEELFYCFYWIMTGIHAAHMVVGVSLMGTMALIVRLGRNAFKWANAIENVGLYWHFVNVVWVFLFPLLYLVGHS